MHWASGSAKMPLGNAGTLSDQDAYDIAAYFTAKPRPDFPAGKNDWPRGGGPSDARRYFSGGSGRPGTRNVVVRPDLWCAPCNLIRTPPRECRGAEGPECLRLVTTDEVHAAAAALLASAGFPRREVA